MRTDLTETLGGVRVRGVVTVAALDGMIGTRTWQRFMEDLDVGDPRVVAAVLTETLKAAGELRPIEVAAEVPRLIETAGIRACAVFALRLVLDAISKAETARKNSPAAEPIPGPAATQTGGE